MRNPFLDRAMCVLAGVLILASGQAAVAGWWLILPLGWAMAAVLIWASTK